MTRAVIARLAFGAALILFTIGAAIPGPQPYRLRVCFLSTTTEEISCATVTDSYSPPASEPSPSP